MHMEARDVIQREGGDSSMIIMTGQEQKSRIEMDMDGVNNNSRLFLESFSARDSDLLDDRDLMDMQQDGAAKSPTASATFEYNNQNQVAAHERYSKLSIFSQPQ